MNSLFFIIAIHAIHAHGHGDDFTSLDSSSNDLFSVLWLFIITVYGSACDYMLALVSIVCGTALFLYYFSL